VYLSGWCGANGCKLFRELKAALGPHVTFFASDNFGSPGPDDPWTPGLYESVAGLPLTHLGTVGRRFLDDFQARYHQVTVSSDVAAAAQSAEIVLDAISRSNGTRPSVTRQLLADQIYDGPLGTFHFDANGDPTKSPFAVYRFPPARAQGRPPYLSQADNGATLYRVITAPPDLAGEP
jgi:ABC-type branched-subunit amino acid transport system substrate-binding protein